MAGELLIEVVKLLALSVLAVLAWRFAGNVASNVFDGFLDIAA